METVKVFVVEESNLEAQKNVSVKTSSLQYTLKPTCKGFYRIHTVTLEYH